MKHTFPGRLVLASAFISPAVFAAPVDINHASAADIAAALSGIGKSKAVAIVAYRNAHGVFKTADDLTHVKGIGPATVKRNRSDILLSASSAGKTAASKPSTKTKK